MELYDRNRQYFWVRLFLWNFELLFRSPHEKSGLLALADWFWVVEKWVSIFFFELFFMTPAPGPHSIVRRIRSYHTWWVCSQTTYWRTFSKRLRKMDSHHQPPIMGLLLGGKTSWLRQVEIILLYKIWSWSQSIQSMLITLWTNWVGTPKSSWSVFVRLWNN